jgi:hypothetical protein
MDGWVCSPSRFTLEPYSRRKFVSSAKQFLPPRSFAPKERRKLASYEVAGTLSANHCVLKGRRKNTIQRPLRYEFILFTDTSHFVAG